MAERAEKFLHKRHVSPQSINVPDGFRVELAGFGLHRPTCLAFNEDGHAFVGEAGRVRVIRPDGSAEVTADGLGRITGITYLNGTFYLIENEISGHIWWLAEDGTRLALLDGLPGGGDNPPSAITAAHSERLYFGQGTRTNSGVVDLESEWANIYTYLCDVPDREIVLAGRNFDGTGAFRPFGVGSYPGERIPGETKSNGSILRLDPESGDLELFATGLRSPRGLAVHPDGRIFCTDRGMEERGSRPVSGAEYVWHVQEGGWYGWPDFEGGRPVPDPVLAEHPPLAGEPVATFPTGTELAGFDFARSPFFGGDDDAFIAHKGGVMILDVGTGRSRDFASGDFEHPVDVKFDRTGESMYILDAGDLPETGLLWRIHPFEIV
ncbi:MAG: PQQ-dependent sugar dehydrogenase [Armatimonadota bacterium]